MMESTYRLFFTDKQTDRENRGERKRRSEDRQTETDGEGEKPKDKLIDELTKYVKGMLIKETGKAEHNSLQILHVMR